MDVRFTGYERFLKAASKNPQAANRVLKAAIERSGKQVQRQLQNHKWNRHYVRWARLHRN